MDNFQQNSVAGAEVVSVSATGFSKGQKYALLFLRLVVGWMFLYAGITKVIDPTWSAEGYLKGAKFLTGFYAWLTTPDVLPVINFVNEWGLTFLGVSLILGIGVRLSSLLGALLMLLYYLPLGFPYPNANSLIVDQHIIYIAILLFLAAVKAGRVYGLESWCESLPLCSKFPGLRKWFG